MVLKQTEKREPKERTDPSHQKERKTSIRKLQKGKRRATTHSLRALGKKGERRITFCMNSKEDQKTNQQETKEGGRNRRQGIPKEEEKEGVSQFPHGSKKRKKIKFRQRFLEEKEGPGLFAEKRKRGK